MWKRKKKIDTLNDILNLNLANMHNFDDFDEDDFDYLKLLAKLEQQNNKRTRNKEYYVKGSELRALIEKYQKSKRADAEKRGVPYEEGLGEISEALGEMIIKICERFSRHPRFFGYSFRDLFVADAVARCITHGVDKINLDLPNCNPFSYFTQISYNEFRQKIKRLKRYQQIKQRVRELIYNLFEKENNLLQTKDNDEDD